MGSSSTSFITLFFTVSLLFLSSHTHESSSFKGVDLANPAIEVTPLRISGNSYERPSKDAVFCERVQVIGISRLKLGSYSSSFRVTLAPSVAIPERLHSRIQVCFHQNASLGLCQCDKDEWKGVQKGIWNSVMSPYEVRYIDVKFTGEVSGSVAVSVEENFQRWRFICLILGLVLLLLAPVISDWVPFYYSSSMLLGVLIIIIIILFQGMKLLPTGRKSALYLTIYGSLIGAGSFVLHQFSVLINSILVNFGLSEDLQNPVSAFIGLGVCLAGAAFGYWIVRKYVISEDGNVDIGVAQFVKWAMRGVAATCIYESTMDTFLVVGAFVCCWFLSSVILSLPRYCQNNDVSFDAGNRWWWRSGQAVGNHKRAEFLSRKGGNRKATVILDSPIKGVCSPSSGREKIAQGRSTDRDHYSTFHKTPRRRKFSKKEWEEFTEESTRQAMAELASSPEFTDWVIENASRIRLAEDDGSDNSCRSGSDSTEEPTVLSGNRINRFLGW